MSYAFIKHLHALFALLTVLAFILRGVLFMRGSLMMESRAAKILTHLVYTGLVGLGVWLAVLTHSWDEAWLITKVAVFFIAMGLGVMAFRQKSTLPKSRRISIWGMALVLLVMVFAIVSFHIAQMSVGVPGVQ